MTALICCGETASRMRSRSNDHENKAVNLRSKTFLSNQWSLKGFHTSYILKYLYRTTLRWILLKHTSSYLCSECYVVNVAAPTLLQRQFFLHFSQWPALSNLCSIQKICLLKPVWKKSIGLKVPGRFGQIVLQKTFYKQHILRWNDGYDTLSLLHI